MSTVLPVVLFGLAGVLVGGTISMVRQGAPRLPLIVVIFFALLAAAGGVLWIVPKG